MTWLDVSALTDQDLRALWLSGGMDIDAEFVATEFRRALMAKSKEQCEALRMILAKVEYAYGTEAPEDRGLESVRLLGRPGPRVPRELPRGPLGWWAKLMRRLGIEPRT